MISNPPKAPNQSPTAKETNTKVTDRSVLAEHKQTFTTERRETNADDVQSFVIVNDIDIEEELNKARKDNQNYFKYLSMSFYGKVKSHSVDRQDSKDSQKLLTHQNEIVKRKGSLQLQKESRKNPTQVLNKQKTQELLKKNLPIKNFNLNQDYFKKRLVSPKEESAKVYSPVVSGKKYQMGNFAGFSFTKKETTFFLEGQSRPNNKKKHHRVEGEENRTTSPGFKTAHTGRSNSPKANLKKFNTVKMPDSPTKAFKGNKDKALGLDNERSIFTFLPNGEGDDREKDYIRYRDISSKGSRTASKQSSRRSSKNGKEKSYGTPNNSGRSLQSTTNSLLKSSLRESIDAKVILFDTDSRVNPIFIREKSPGREGKKLELKVKNKEKKVNQPNIKTNKNPIEKLKKLGLADFRDSDNEGENCARSESQPRKEYPFRKKEKHPSNKIKREKSLVTNQIHERIPTTLNGTGIGNWGMKSVFFTRENVTNKSKHKERGKEKIAGEIMEGKSFKSSSLPARSAAESRTSSTEKLKNLDIFAQFRTKKKESFEYDKNPRILGAKFDFIKLQEDKNAKKYEAYGKIKESRAKTRPTSPAPLVDCRLPFDLLDRFLLQKKGVREKS